MLSDSEGDEWIFRRNPAIRGLLSGLGLCSGDGVPYLVPEVQLLYKSKGLRPKDQADFDSVQPRLGLQQKAWLKDALRKIYPERHPWLGRL